MVVEADALDLAEEMVEAKAGRNIDLVLQLMRLACSMTGS